MAVALAIWYGVAVLVSMQDVFVESPFILYLDGRGFSSISCIRFNEHLSSPCISPLLQDFSLVGQPLFE
jgi:hypothetical protein